MKTATPSDQSAKSALNQKGLDPGPAAFGIWSGGHFLNFGQDIGANRLTALVRQAYESGIRTFLTADVYGEGAADTLLGEALRPYARESYCLVGMVGHDFYEGQRQGEKGFPRFTDSALRKSDQYAAYLETAAKKSLHRLGTSYFDVLMLHNPDFIGYTSPQVWQGMAQLKQRGLTRATGIAPGPANGFTLDLLGAFEKFHDSIEWAMIILSPMEPWPGSLILPAAEKFGIKVMTRVVDFGGLFHGNVKPGLKIPRTDHRSFRGPGWIEAAQPKLERFREIADKQGLSLLQLACAWTLAQTAVACAVPTLVQEMDPETKPVEKQLEDLAALNPAQKISPEIAAEMTRIGDNRNCMALKGASAQYLGAPQADQWPLAPESAEIASRWGIVPDRDLFYAGDPRDLREIGTPRAGVPQTLNRRLYVQLQVFTGCKNPQLIADQLRASGLEAVLYLDVNDPQGIGILILSENPETFVREAREIFSKFQDLTRRPEFTMMGRTYSAGREPQLEDWLLRKPRRNALNPRWPWAVWYPLRRKPEFELLPKSEQDAILFEHARIGRNYGECGYAADIRLACYGLDAADNEFVLGLTGPELFPLSRLVQDMRKTQQTAKYMQSLGPFFVGRVYWQAPFQK